MRHRLVSGCEPALGGDAVDVRRRAASDDLSVRVVLEDDPDHMLVDGGLSTDERSTCPRWRWRGRRTRGADVVLAVARPSRRAARRHGQHEPENRENREENESLAHNEPPRLRAPA